MASFLRLNCNSKIKCYFSEHNPAKLNHLVSSRVLPDKGEGPFLLYCHWWKEAQGKVVRENALKSIFTEEISCDFNAKTLLEASEDR